MNLKTIMGTLGLCLIIGGWMVTANTTESNKTEIKETKKDIQDLKAVVIRQTAQVEAQQTYNENVVKILERISEK